MIYADDPEQFAKSTPLLRATNGLALSDTGVPTTQLCFDRRGQPTAGAPAGSITEAAADALTGPGRMPAEGEAFLTWMQRKTPSWQTPNLGAGPLADVCSGASKPGGHV